ncbi:hypothetical protein [Chryseobacterium gossypii]|uniref:hypothetical protein n=1 Tax=Chryseobacterium gossypii TaxID=3231602 RepID=UPI003524224B
MNLKNLNVAELDAQELKETEGGWIIPVLVGLAWSAWENVGDIREGFSDGYNGVKPRH